MTGKYVRIGTTTVAKPISVRQAGTWKLIQSVPAAPTSVAATAGNQVATVSWTPPTNSGGMPITSYQITTTPGGAVSTVSASPAAVNGLTNGTAYSFTVTAINAVGTSVASTASVNVTPTASSYPDATTTGPTSTSFTSVGGPSTAGPGWSVDSTGDNLNITADNTVFNGYDCPYTIVVKAANVTIQNNRITVSGDGDGIQIGAAAAGTIQILDNLIQGPDNSPGQNWGYQTASHTRLQYGVNDHGRANTGLSVKRNHFRGINHPLQVVAGAMQDNYMHAFGNSDGTEHTDGLQSGNSAGLSMSITHNTILNDRQDATTATILLSVLTDPNVNVTIQNNLLGGGGYILYGGENATYPAQNILVEDNKITTQIYPNGGYYGVFTDMPTNGVNGCVISNNTWYDGPNVGQIAS